MSAKVHGFKFYTYVHTRNDTGEVFYVGKGQGERAFSKGRNNIHWNNIVAKHGRTVHIIAYWEDETFAFAHEKELIAEFRASGVVIVNQTDGGDGTSGYKQSAEHKAKVGAKHKGKIVSIETRAKMALAKVGRKRRAFSPECRAKLRVAALGKIISPEQRAKISASLRGRKIAPDVVANMTAATKARYAREKGDTV